MPGRSSALGTGGGSSQRSRSALWGVASAVIALGIVVYGVYGDPDVATNGQESSMPFLIAFALAGAVVVFGVLAPRALRPGANTGRWGLGFSLAGLLSVFAFWSGLPVILGAAGILAGSTARQDGVSSASSWAMSLGALAVVAAIAIVVLGNTLLA